MCHPIGFVFFWMHQKSKNTTLVSSYWICFLGSPIGFAFLEAPKKQKHNPCALLLDLFFLKAPKKQKHNPCALLLDLFFLKAPKKQKHNPCVLLLDLLFGLSYWICFFGSPKKTKTQPLCPPIGFVFSESTKKAKTQPLCPSIGFAFLAAPKKQKHNPYALLLDLLFWQPQKSKNKTLVPSYCICFFWMPQKSKKNWCPRIGCAFSKATKKKKHNPYAKHKHNPCALVLDLLFWQPRKTKTASTTRSTWRNVSLTWIITTN